MSARDPQEDNSTPPRWRPDPRTVGLLMAGLFGIVTIGFAFRAGSPAA